jgi:SH3-like domain-containing protein
VSLKTDDVNMRAGPGMNYPIEWVYHRIHLPVQILREFDVWRLIEDEDGIKGWVHQATLSGRRTFETKGAVRVLRDRPHADAAPVARLEPGVVGRLRRCEAKSAWCAVQVGDYHGYLRRDEIVGVYADEAVTP